MLTQALWTGDPTSIADSVFRDAGLYRSYYSAMSDPVTDPLTPFARQVIQAASFEKFVVDGPTPSAAKQWLAGVRPDQLLTVPIVSSAHGYAMLAGLWLWHDSLAECHEIAQTAPANLHPFKPAAGANGGKLALDVRSENLTGVDPARRAEMARDAGHSLDFWHAIMHRREGDFSNAKYWYDRTEAHPLLTALGLNAAVTLNPYPAEKSLLRVLRGGWDPAALVDLIAEVHRRPADPRVPVARALQHLEWRMLFDHCVRQAVGG